MKLIVQVPCYNEAETLPATLADIPRHIEGIDEIEVLIVDDGSTDNTTEVARQHGADHIVRLKSNRGLAVAFSVGLEKSLELGADIIVNTDADNQYKGECIPDLIAPILHEEADLVVGTRPIEAIAEFSWLKKKLQRLGSWVVRQVSGTDIADATSGFRAYSLAAAMHLSVVSDFTYTLETLIQAGRTNLAIAQVPIQTNPQARASRLFSSIPAYIYQSSKTILRIYALYRPLRFFATVGLLLFLPGLALGLRFVYYYITGNGTGHVQSLILATVLMLLGFQILIFGVVADLIGANRKLVQNILSHLRKEDVARANTESGSLDEA